MQINFKVGFSIIAGLFVGLGAIGAYAQETGSPTPAPTKTVTPDAVSIPTTTGEAATEESSGPSQSLAQPWTQSDLSILTGNVQRPNGIAWHNGKLYTACNGDYTLYEIDDRTAATRTYIYGVRNAHMLYPEEQEGGRLALWVPDFETNRLLFIDGAGTPQPIATDMEGPWGIARLSDDEFLVTNQRGDNLVAVSRDGDTRTILSDLRLPTGLATDDDYVYVANYGRPRRAIEWFEKSAALADESGETAEVTSNVLVSGLQNTTGVIMAGDGYLYFAYALGTRGVVGRVDPEVCRENGGCSNADVEIVVYTELASPIAGLAVSPDMRLFMHTMFSPDIYWLQLDNPAAADS